VTSQNLLAGRPTGEIERPPTRAEDAYEKIREDLGQVAPRHPVTRKLGARRDRLDILRDICTRETFGIVMNWLASSTIPSINTKRAYADDLRFWHEFAQERGHDRFSIGCITRGDITTWRLSEEKRGRKDRSIARRLSALSSLTVFAAEEAQVFIANPVTRTNRPKIDRRDRTSATPVLEVDEIGALYDWAESLLDVVTTGLVYTFAGRVSEWCEADVADFHDGRRPLIDITRKGNKGRVFPLPPILADLLVKLIGDRTDGPLLLDSQGKRLDRHDVDRILTRLGKRAGVLTGRDVTPHVLRASRLTHMHDANEKLEDIQAYADHADPATTLRYIERRDEDKKRASQAAAGVDLFSSQFSRWLTAA
jgi:integrase